MHTKKIVVITTPNGLDDIELPIPRSIIEHIADTGGTGFTIAQEKSVMAWGREVSVNGFPFPLDDERMEQVASGGRTSKIEDEYIATWILNVWDIIEKWKKYA